MKKKILYTLLILFAIIQFKRIDTTPASVDPAQDFFAVHDAPEDVKALIHTACYDCHSGHTTYPWYSQIAPVSWWLADHVEEGREHFDYSTWTELEPSKRDHKLEEAVEMLTEKEMPMLPYMIAHNDAWISQEQRDLLISYFQGLRN